MASPSPSNVREVRYLSGTTFNTAFTNAASGTWAAGTAIKLRVNGFEPAINYESQPDPTLQSQRYSGKPNIPTLRKGSIKFNCMLDGAKSNTDSSALATLLSKITGGVAAPGTARTDQAEAGGSTTLIKAAAHGVKSGTAVLAGTRGDAKGNAEARPITATNADALTATMAWPGIPGGAGTNALVYSTTVYLHPEATQSYVDLLAIGHDATDQIQAIGCMGPFSISGLEPGQLPTIGFEFNVGDWQYVPSGYRDALEPTVAAQGNNPAVDRGIGGFFFNDNGSTTRTVFKVANLTINPGITFTPINDQNGINGIGGYCKVPSVPTAEFSILLEGSTDPLTGMYDDFANGANSTGAQAKQLLIQYGHTAQKCVLFEFPKFWLDGPPVPVEINGLQGVKIVGHGEMAAYNTANADAALIASALKIHFF